ncbi:MAG: T9SS type A sorting domain-containing protein, partial [Candidatus Marinimicrobia bacterium]|nr:T9SS type A sorting domain-containing protein [Candidatus Neomarinimicrobiota bacterium]
TLIDAALDEDISWTDTIALTDPDLFVMQGDSFTYKAITTRLVGSVATDSVKIDSSGVLTWTPTQNDTGTYEIQVIATDAYAFADTFKLPLIVSAVNDTPVVDILSPDNNLEWVEDDTATVKINLTSYLEDVDNNDSTEITWQAIILDTTQLDEDFPLGRVIVGPGTPWNVHSSLLREYLGFDLNPKGMKSPVISRRTTNQINTRNNMSNPLLSVTINTISSGESWAYFNSDSNYYGSDHRIIFIAQDPYGAEDRDTVIVTVLPKNDAPIISEIPLIEVTENDSIYLKFGAFTTDIDDTDLTFTISATTNEDKISISPSTFLSNDVGDSVLFLPEKLWSQDATIKVIVTDNDEASDTATFILDVIRVPRPEIKVAVVQNNAFSNYLQVIVTDTVSKTKFISLEVQNEDIDLDTIAAFTWAGDFNFSTAGNYSIDVLAIADVGDTVVTELIALAAAREASRWFGRSVDGRFSVAGDPGSVSYDQSFIIVDSSLFADDFNDQASYVLGDEFFEFGKPIEVRFGSQRDDLAIYRRKNGVTWEELPSILIDGEIFTFSEKTGYFKLGPKTIIVPEETNIHQNYPNPFNPITTIMYDIGLMEGLSQNVSITIYNLLGQHVKTLIHDKDQVGQFTVQWNGQNEFGQPMSTGVYFVQLTTKTGIIKNKKMMLLK